MKPPEPAARESDLLASLNAEQREAVLCPGGPLLVLAGAGSGKTRVITHRIAHLIRDRHIPAFRVVAVTFTNKAAGEMRDRVEDLLGMRPEGSWIGTFHALCLRILRQDGACVGLQPGFVVYDTDDQTALVRRILRDENLEDVAGGPRPVLYRIGRAKNAMVSPDEMASRARSAEAETVARVYSLYEDALRRANAADFDDLLLRALELFEVSADALDRWAGRCEHLLVDEYQDTNRPQYLLVRRLSSAHGNVCVVGDEDQSIYRFRGADIRNILDFEKDHPDAVVIRLEQNYRSTGTILDAAGTLIANNRDRKGKTLWTENARGDRIELCRTADDRREAAWIVRRAASLGRDGVPWEHVAVLYRTNAQSRQIEEALRKRDIPYQVVGSVRFYERKEIKDVLAFARLAVNAADDTAFRRAIATPPRGIGEATVRVIAEVSRDLAVPLLAAARKALEQGLVASRPGKKLAGFLDLVGDLEVRAADVSAPAFLNDLVPRIGYPAYLEKTFSGEASDRIENVQALVSAAVEHERDSDDPGLHAFLDRSALVADADQVGSGPGVTLMTIHCAKGLEYPFVFLAGLEESLFPHARSAASPDDLEEERRLCYVALTRAKRKVFLSLAAMRLVQGVPMPCAPSRFVSEIPEALVEEVIDAAPLDGPGSSPWGIREASGSSAARAARRGRASESHPPPAAGPDPGDGFPVGATVRHPSFGVGRIRHREGSGKTLKLTIQFTGQGSRKILPAYTTLERL